MSQAVTLVQMRQQKKWTLSRLSEQSGVAVTTIVAIERCSKPRLSTIEKLCATLGCSPDDIAWPGDVASTHEEAREEVHAPFRYCLEFLAHAGTFELDNSLERIRPEKYLIGTDMETSWLQAPATLEMYWAGRHPEEGDIAGNLEVEFQSAILDGPVGKEIVYRKERWAVRYVARSERDEITPLGHATGMIHREAADLEARIKVELPTLPGMVEWRLQGLNEIPFTDAMGKGTDRMRFRVRLLGPQGLPADVYSLQDWEVLKAKVKTAG